MSAPVFQVQIKGGASYPVLTDQLLVGTVSTCAVALRDPVASEEHCRIARTPQGFAVEDLDSATGTWVNGIPCDEPTRLMDGDVIVVGVSRLRVHSAGAALEVTVEEAEFQYTKSGAGGAKRESDDWVRSEVTFGRIPAIRAAGWIAAAATLLFLLLLALGPVGDEVLMPGPVRAAHARLFVDDPATLDARLAAQATLAQEQGCAVCHDSFDGTTLANCGACHADKVSDATHPFRAEAGEYPKGRLAADTCVYCHSEHQVTGEILRAPEDELPGCDACHPADVLAEVQALRSRWAEAEEGASAPAQVTTAPVAYRDFDHAAHLRVEGIACGACHALGEPSEDHGDFGPVSFETCMECHAADGRPADPGLAAAASAVPAALRFDLAWHGTDAGTESCEQCHTAEPRTGAFRVVESPRSGALRVRLRRSHHEGVFEPSRCIECHRTGAPSVEQGVAEARFHHGVHLAQLDPGGDVALAERLSDDCAQCHAQQAAATSLRADRGAADYHGAGTARCAECHRDAAGDSLIVDVVAGKRLGTVERRDFSHAQHVDAVEGGCFRCHEFEQSGDLFSALPVTPESVRDCTACHAGHANLGGGDCAVCHESVGGAVAAVFRGEPARRTNRPVQAPFDHRAGGLEGHLGFVQSGSCTHCHLGLDAATDVPSVQLPFREQAACQACHGGAFHFSRRAER